MQVNSKETLRRAVAFRAAHGNKSWLELARENGARERSLAFFAGGSMKPVTERRSIWASKNSATVVKSGE